MTGSVAVRVRLRRPKLDYERLAARLGITARALRQAAKHPTFPVAQDGGCPIAAVRAWFVTRARARVSDNSSERPSRGQRTYGGGDALPSTDSAALTRLREARARTAELALRQKERELMPTKETADLLARWATSFKWMLLAIPARMSDRLNDSQRADLTAEVMALLTGLFEMRDDYLQQAEELGLKEAARE